MLIGIKLMQTFESLHDVHLAQQYIFKKAPLIYIATCILRKCFSEQVCVKVELLQPLLYLNY